MMRYSMKFEKKKTEIKIKFQKMKGTYLFRQHPLVEKSPTAIDEYVYLSSLLIAKKVNYNYFLLQTKIFIN